jgi:hypothetical protein
MTEIYFKKITEKNSGELSTRTGLFWKITVNVCRQTSDRIRKGMKNQVRNKVING